MIFFPLLIIGRAPVRFVHSLKATLVRNRRAEENAGTQRRGAYSGEGEWVAFKIRTTPGTKIRGSINYLILFYVIVAVQVEQGATIAELAATMAGNNGGERIAVRGLGNWQQQFALHVYFEGEQPDNRLGVRGV
jgi:hypothetical protein